MPVNFMPDQLDGNKLFRVSVDNMFMSHRHAVIDATHGEKSFVCLHGRMFEVFQSDRGIYAHTHCACRSTMSSGDYLPSLGEAVRVAKESIEQHEASCSRAKSINQKENANV